jgi:DNA-damage-inducible protein J
MLTTSPLTKTDLCQFRIDRNDKAATYAVFNDLGLTPSMAVRLFFRQVRTTRAIPFQIEHTPNEMTIASMRASDAGVGVKTFATGDDMFSHLDALTK